MGIADLFLPREEKFYDMLKQQSENVAAGSRKFEEFMRNYSALSLEERSRRVKELKELELSGDRMVQALTEALNRTFITPIDREDIHRLSMMLDDVIDFIHAGAMRFLLFGVEEYPAAYVNELSSLITKATAEMDMAIGKLKTNNIGDHVTRIGEMGDASEKVFHRALFDLFNNDYEVKDIMKLREIYDLLRTVMDRTDAVAGLVGTIVVKHG